VDLGLYGFALAAGMVAAFNPCGFAMMPAYLSLTVHGSGHDSGEAPGGARALGRALGATAAMTAGFVLVFGTFGLLVAPLAAAVQAHLPWVTVAIGLGLLVLGGWLLSGRELTVLLPRPGCGAPTARIGSMLGYGVAYALASLSCTIGPFAAVTATAFRAGSTLTGIAAFVAYGLGMTLVVGPLAVAVALAGDALALRARTLLPWLNRITGALLVAVGLYVGYYGVFELRLADAGGPDDPVISAAATVQGTLVGWLDTIGPWPPVAVFAVLIVVGVAMAIRARRAAR
jgi:cytochrome c biogenesis protein CcdA